MFHIELTFFVKLPSSLSLRSLPHSAANRQDLGASCGNGANGLSKGSVAEYIVGIHVVRSVLACGVDKPEKFSGLTCVKNEPRPSAAE